MSDQLPVSADKMFPVRTKSGLRTIYLKRHSCGAAGFTLIELLVVVMIITILAAIAIPNFLEAQIRAKVARSKNDMRTIATALETYAVDQNKYPPNFDTDLYVDPPASEYRTYAALTTPVSYLSTAPTDIFRPDPTQPSRENYFEFVGIDSVAVLPVYTPANRDYWLSSGMRWFVSCIGPDRKNDEIYNVMEDVVPHLYDATNGTVSHGDFARTNVAMVPNR